MKRRQVLAAIGALSGTGAVLTGTGAFTSVEADRDVAVQVATDSMSYLSIKGIGPNEPYTTTEDGQLGIDLTSDNATGAGGQGVNTSAVTMFEQLFEVRNQGTQDVDVEITPLTFVETDSGNTLMVLVVPQTGFPSTTLSPGSTETYSLVVDVHPGGTSPGIEIDDTMTISAEAN